MMNERCSLMHKDYSRKKAKSYWDSLYRGENSKKKNVLSNSELENHQREMRKSIIKQYIPKGASIILEAGCGSGQDLNRLSNEYSKSLFVGLDYSLQALQKCCSLTDNMNLGRFVQGDILSLPFRDNTFDLIFNSGVIEHFRDTTQPLDEMIRVTKPGGYVIAFVPNTFSFWVFGKNALNILNKISFGKVRPWPVWEKSFNRFSLKSLSKRLNLSDTHLAGIHLLHYYLAIDLMEKAVNRSIFPTFFKRYTKKFLVNLDEKSTFIKLLFGMEVVLIGKVNKSNIDRSSLNRT